MGKTIIQTIGPLYGEVINGTVFGRPNGSVFVPISNTIVMSSTNTTVLMTATYFRTAGRTSAVAESQDLANYIERQVYSDSECTDLIAVSDSNAGSFNEKWDYYARIKSGITPPSAGDKVYLRCQLMASSGVPVATSEVVELEVTV